MSDQENSDSNAKEQELAKQLSTYADGFTAFSFVQGATFCFLVVQNAAVACELRSQWVVAEVCLAIGGAGYFLLLYLCKRGEDKLLIPAVRGGQIISEPFDMWGLLDHAHCLLTVGPCVACLPS
jgi:hypothetical protein